MAKGGGSQTTTQVNKVELPAWVDQASQENYQMAKDITGKPYQAYGGQQVASMDPTTQQAIDATKASFGATDPQFAGAAGSLQGLLDKNIGQVTAGTIKPQTWAGSDINPYLNPYIENVENKTIDAMNRNARLTANDISSQASKAGKAFGGSRFGIQQGVASGENTRNIGEMSAGLRKAGFDTASGLLTGDITRDMAAQTSNVANRLSAEQGNQAAALDEIRAKTGAATSLTNNAAQQASTKLADIGSLYQAGSTAQDQKQRELSQAEANWEREQAYPMEMLNARLASLGMSPYGRTETQTKTEPKKSGTDWATAALGGAKTGLSLLQMIPGLSEDSTKTDIEKVGNISIKGKKLPVNAYRYKNDPKTYPKVVGLMASDVQKAVPSAVGKIGKKRVIDYTKLQRSV